MLTDFVDNYCERLGPGLWAEPFNLVSNAVFYVVAFVIWREAKTLAAEKRRPLEVAALLLLITGIGSSLFHSFATRWAEIADVVPIGVFLLYYLWLFLAILWGGGRGTVVKGLLAFGAVTAFFALTFTHPVFNRSQTYFGTLVTLMAMGWLTRERVRHVSRYYWGAAGAFFLALTCRSIDMRLCPDWPLGTHFLWHTLNGIVTYLVLKAALVWLRDPKSKS